jgi:DNA polymerase-3 subunit alpha
MIVNAHSYFSLRYGTLSLKEITSLAKECGIDTLLLTDINNSSAAIDFVKHANANGIRPIVGIEFRNNGTLLYTGIARNNNGFYQLNKHLSASLMANAPVNEQPPESDDVFIVYPLDAKPGRPLNSNEYIGILPHQVNKVYSAPAALRSQMVAMHTVTFQRSRKAYNLHRVLRAIDLNTILPKLTPANVAPANQFMVPHADLLSKYSLFPQLAEQADALLAQCNINFEYRTPKNKVAFTTSVDEDNRMLQSLAEQGFAYRYPHPDQKTRDRFLKELRVIRQLGFASYFLLAWDIIRFAESRGFPWVGRGSGANSLIAYCLRITDVDPIELDLYFERFINPHRTSPPDFDIDFSWDQRDEVINYVFQKHGLENVALIATYTTFQGRSSIREIAKTFGLPKFEIDRLIKQPDHVLNRNSVTADLLTYALMLEDFPNYLGIHAGGIIISETSLFNFTAMQMMPKGFPIVQWDMYVAEDIGFYKFDILSQRGLGHIKETVDIVRENRGMEIDIHQVSRFMKDKRVLQQLRSGDTIGCFYIESPAMRGLLNKLRCGNYLSLVAASSIIRPGVASSGMMRQYIERFHNSPFTYLHPVMEEHLAETFGIMIYQEDVIKIAHYFAGIDLADADILRRAMSGKFRSSDEMGRITHLFFHNCKQRGYPDDLTQEVWRQIESFSGYSFSKAHSASYAVESFQSLFLKTYFPLEFMVAVINNRGGFYSTEFYVHEARMAGAEIHEPCVNRSQANTCIYGTDIFIGLSFVKGLEFALIRRILHDRETFGAFNDLQDFLFRIHPETEQTMILIRMNALRFTGLSKKELMWHCQFILKAMPKTQGPALFRTAVETFTLPPLIHNPFDDLMDQLELLGFTLSSPFDMVEGSTNGTLLTRDLPANIGNTITIAGYFVNDKKVRTKNGDIMKFGCFIDVEGKFFDAVLFPPELRQYPLTGRGCYMITGKVVSDFGYPSIEIRTLYKMPVRARDQYQVQTVKIENLPNPAPAAQRTPLVRKQRRPQQIS